MAGWLARALGTLALGAVAVAVSAGTGRAQTVTGGLWFSNPGGNQYDPANRYVPAGAGNAGGVRVAVGPWIEFAYNDGMNADTADFGDGILLVSSLSNQGTGAWEQRFTASTPGFFDTVILSRSTFPAGFDFHVSGDTLVIDFAGADDAFQASATFLLAAPGPVAGAGLLPLLGLAAAGAARRCRAA